jgi:hypothetical protein
MTLLQLLRRDSANSSTAGEHLKRLRKAAHSADKGEGVSLRGLSREERRRLLAGN